MTYAVATIAGNLLDWVTDAAPVRVQMTRLEGASVDGQDAHVAGFDREYGPDKPVDAAPPVVAVGTYKVKLTARFKTFPAREFTAPITGDTSWGEVLSYDGTGYEYTPDELGRLVAVERLDEVTDLGTWGDDSTIPGPGSYAITLDADATITLPTSHTAPVLLWLIPSGGTHVATINGTAVTVSTRTPIAYQYVLDAWVRLSSPGGSSGGGGGGGSVSEDPDDPGTFLVTSSALTEDPDDAGTYLIGDAA